MSNMDQETPLQQLGRLLAESGAVPNITLTANEWRSVLDHHTQDVLSRAERAEKRCAELKQELADETASRVRQARIIEMQGETITALRANIADANAREANHVCQTRLREDACEFIANWEWEVQLSVSDWLRRHEHHRLAHNERGFRCMDCTDDRTFLVAAEWNGRGAALGQ